MNFGFYVILAAQFFWLQSDNEPVNNALYTLGSAKKI